MNQRALFIHLISCLSSFYLCNATIGDLKLELVQVLFRHGLRTPTAVEALYVNVTDASFYSPSGYHQLTNEGKRQAYQLGTLLRKKYNKFLGAYNPKEYYAMSTSYSRTSMSLQLTISGLFPPSPGDSWNNKLHWRPASFRQSSPNKNIILSPYLSKKFLDLYIKTVANSCEYQQKFAKYTDFLMDMENKTGFSFRNDLTVYHVTKTYLAIKYHKDMRLRLPNWYTDDSIYTNFAELLKLSFDGLSWTPQLKRLNGGTLVRQFVENIKANRKAAVPKKVYLYCAHDVTLYAFSKAQNVEAFYLPPSGSALIMEKYSDSRKSEYVRMLAWDTVGENFMSVGIGNCEEFCPFEEYMEIVKDYMSSDEDLEYLNDAMNKGVLNLDN